MIMINKFILKKGYLNGLMPRYLLDIMELVKAKYIE